MFTDGTSVYGEFAKEYITHKQGFFILAPSGSGKTYFINHQKEKHWIDGDILWEKANAHPTEEWWLESREVNDEVDQKSDIITMQAKKLGFWILGASNFWLPPDAIVLPHWSTHKKYIKARETNNYDGGATSDRFGQVLHHRQRIRKWKRSGVPEFKSIAEATECLTKRYGSRD